MNEFYEKFYKTLVFYRTRALRVVRGIRFDLLPLTMEQPVFIVGCSRAGTTLVYKTLSESSRLGTLNRETHDFWAELHPPSERDWSSHEIPATCASNKDRYTVSRYFYLHTGMHRFVDKNNQNGLSIPYLQGLYPDAYFVYVKRHPGDNIHSLIEGWRRAETFATWSDHLPEQVNIENGQFKRWCFFLAEGWREYLDASIEDVCAFQYRQMNKMILKGKNCVDNNRWCEIFYEDILDNPVRVFEKVFEFCQIPFDKRVKAHCAEVLQNPYNAFSKIGKDKWKSMANREKIEKVLPKVWTVAKEMGYIQ